MSPDLDKTLVAKYPKIFADRSASMEETAMCWGFDIGDGWYQLLDDACARIQTICDENGFQVKATQIKEKFGTLRFYTDVGNEEIWNILDEADVISSVTCEVCGAPGKIVGKNWLKTLCGGHAKTLNN